MTFSNLRFRYPFRRYQQMILDVLQEQTGDDHKYHIVSPPGSGKTIVGLELIRRFGQPAAVFCPTTTIQKQWQERLNMFTSDPSWIDEHTSLDPRNLSELNIMTYQVLSTPGENLEFVERMAIEQWLDDLLSSDRVTTRSDAQKRITTLQEANPKAYRREVSRRYRRIKREFLQDGRLDGRQFLHPNAQGLIDRIVALGTGTVVLDECHHLLDYWAFILHELLRSLPGVRVVGLTATLPDPENQVEVENYTSLLGEVDFEVPTPAVVKEGNLAPYRDLVYFCEPSPREQDYLQEIQKHFETAVWQATNSTPFRDWLWRTLFPSLPMDQNAENPPNPSAILDSFEKAFRREPLLCIAAIKYLLELGVSLPLHLPIIEEMLEPLEADDWLILMENYALQALKISADPQHQALYDDLRDALLPFGITISERGLRHNRSPADLVMALSESKDRATVRILRSESEAMEHKLRAVVITDYEQMSARTRRLKGILDPDAGSAMRVFRLLVADPVTELLAPVLVSGKVVLVSARSSPLMEGSIRRWVEENKADFSWEWEETRSDQVLRLAGKGPDWSSRTYVALVTDLFERGITRCLVGTRGIFGEGWDALRLNTLVDLTAVTTRTGVQQIRGRPIRLDPSWPRKVAHNWDVVCVSREFDKGEADLRRFAARHEHTWGIIMRPWLGSVADAVDRSMDKVQAPESLRTQALAEQDSLAPLTMQGRVVRGVSHVDLQLATDLATRDFKRVPYQRYTRRMLEAVWDRDRVYGLWEVGRPYDNSIFSATRIDARDLKFRTNYTIQNSLRTMVWGTLTSVLAVGGVVLVNGAWVLPWAQAQSLPGLAIGSLLVSGTAAAAAVVTTGRRILRTFRHAFLELPADAILLDMGRALLSALRDSGAVSPHLDDQDIRISDTQGGGYEVFLDPPTEEDKESGLGVSPEDAHTFSRAYEQMLGPLGDARYLIERDNTTLRNLIYRPLWHLVRKTIRLEEDLKAYHRVPDLLATRRERAETLARYWQYYVGGGRLIYTRTVEGRRILLQARAQQRKQIRQMVLEIWQ